MQKRLEKMPESFSQKDIKKLEGSFEKIEKSAEITSSEQQRILSSVMRKAGIEMNDNRTRDNIKVTRGFKGFGAVAAAAAVLIVGVSAVSVASRIKDEGNKLQPQAGSSLSAVDDKAGEPFAEQKLTDSLLGVSSYDLINKYGLYDTYTAEDDCFKVTFGSVISDGTKARMIVKCEPKTKEAQEYLELAHPLPIYVFDPDTKEIVFTPIGGQAVSDEFVDSDDGVYYCSLYIDLIVQGRTLIDREVILQPEYEKFADGSIHTKETDFTFDESKGYATVNLSKNIPTNEYVCEDGKRLIMSAYGFVSEELSDGEYSKVRDFVNALDSGDTDKVIMTLEYSDGQKRDVTVGELGGTEYAELGYIGFDGIRPDPESISAVEINGNRYIKESTDELTAEKFFGTGYYDFIKKNSLDSEYEAEDDNFKLNISCIVSDGKRAMMLVKTTGKTPEAIDYLKRQPLVNLNLYYADTEANIHVYGSASGYENSSFDGNYTATSLSTIELESIDTSRDIYLQIGSDGFEDNKAYGDSDETIFDSSKASVKVNLSKNINTRTLTCGSKSLMLTDLAVFSDEYGTEESIAKFNDKLVNDPAVILTLEFDDGTSKDITNSDVSMIFDNYKMVYFKDILDNCNTVSAVVINGNRYTAGTKPSIEDNTVTNPDKAATEDNDTAVFAQLPRSFTFSSGAGGWSTGITIEDDGTFTGSYHDSDMGDTGEDFPNGTIYISDFSGDFTNVKKIDDHTYSMKLGGLNVFKTPGESYVEDGVKYIYSEPYGFDDADEFMIYLPGSSLSDLPDEFLAWAHLSEDGGNTLPSGVYGIYNVGGKEGFIGTKE